MDAVYYDLSGKDALTRRSLRASYSERQIGDFLSGQDSYTNHRPVRRRFRRRRTFSKGPNDLMQIDLIDVSNLARYNDGYRFILACICVFSKVAHAVALKTKKPSEVADAFEREIIVKKNVRPVYVQSDLGKEFTGAQFQRMLKKHGIRWYSSSNSDIKAAVVERFIRTIQGKIHKYFTYRNTRRYVDDLPKLITAYNNTFHRSIQMRPNEVDSTNLEVVAARLYPPKPSVFRYRFKVGDCVKISCERMAFSKGYRGNWSRELFIVTAALPTDPVTYELRDLNGKDIKGRFYEPELQCVKRPELYTVEKVIKKRKLGKKTQYFVKWLGYGPEFNSWTDDIRRVNNN